ncbi:nucleotidyltransferase domain-containing protein [Candidatus Electrothrix sp.]|uniref:nucleotidyltransferase domain-containing protein n=1 Tax=Candidatus Electrothrix sp. TaxID=2170559 RepID=UPI004057017F
MGQDTVLVAVKRFKKVLESVNIRVEQLILFGSHASGTARKDSDIDLVVISSSFSDKSYWERIDILTDAIYQVVAPIEASAFTPDEWKSEKSLMFDYVKNGVSV